MASPYEVAIHLTVTGNAQAGLAGMSKQVDNLNKGVRELHKAFALLFVGGEMKRWGEDALGFVKKMLDAAGNFQHVQSQMSAMGMSQTEIADSVASSWREATKNIHVGVQEMAEMNRHAIEIFGGAGAAAEHMPLMAKLAEFQAKWGAGKTGLKQVDVPIAIRDMMKTTEGAAMLQKDPKIFDDFAEKLMRSIISAGGNVSATQYLQAQRLARGAQFGWTDEYRFGVFPALVQEYGHAAGTSAYQSFKKLGAGVSWDKTGIVQGIQMGLIDPSKVEYDKVGRPMRLMPGALYYAKEFGADPLKFTEQHITPWLDKNVGPDPAERTAAIVRLLGKATGTTTIQAYDMQSYKLHKDIGQFKQARMEMPDDYAQAMKAFEEKWKDFTVAIGTPSLKMAAEALGSMTKAILAITGAAIAHPDAAKNLLAFAAGFGATMTVLGTLAIGAGIASLLGGGVVIVGLTALTGALAGLAAANWPAVSSWGKRLITSIMDKLNQVQKAITDMLQRIIDWIVSKIPSWIKNINFTGDGFGGAGGGMGSSGALSAGERGQYAGIIRKVAMQEGVDPNALLKIYGTEGANAWFGDGGHSIGPFQLYDQGLGAAFHGDRSRSAHGVEDQARFVARYGKSHGGWSSGIWHGLRDQGVGSIPFHPHRSKGGETVVHNHIYLDGKPIAKSTSKQLARAAQYPTSVGRQDGRGVFMGPGAEVFA